MVGRFDKGGETAQRYVTAGGRSEPAVIQTLKRGLRRSPIALPKHYSTSSKPISKEHSCPQVRFAHPRLRIVEPLQGSMARNEARRQIARNPKAGKLPHGVGTESQAAKASPRRGHGIASCENFPTAWARNRKLRKLPHSVGTESQAAKASPRRGHGIAAINRRGVSHTPEYIHNDKWTHSGRMRYAPTSTLFTNH